MFDIEQSKSSSPLNSSSYFDGNNYSHWKVLMMFFLKMKGERVWNSVEYGLGPPLILYAQERLIGKLKPKHKWDKVDNEGSEANVKALFSIFNGVCSYEFRRITNCKHAKEAWDILQVTHEGTSTVKISKLQMLVTKFKIKFAS